MGRVTKSGWRSDKNRCFSIKNAVMRDLNAAINRINKVLGVPSDQLEILINQVCAIGEVRELEYKRLVYYGLKDQYLKIGMSATDFKNWFKDRFI